MLFLLDFVMVPIKYVRRLSTSQSRWFYSTNHKDIGTLHLALGSSLVLVSYNTYLKTRNYHHNVVYRGGDTVSSQGIDIESYGFPIRDNLALVKLISLSDTTLNQLKQPYLFYDAIHTIVDNKCVKNDELFLYSSDIIISSVHNLDAQSTIQTREYFHLGNESDIIDGFVYFAFLVLVFEIKNKCSETVFKHIEEFLESIMNKLLFLFRDDTNTFSSMIIKELFISLLSYLISPSDYYFWGTTKHSVIKDFFDSFMLLNLHKTKFDTNLNYVLLTYPPENTLQIATKKTLLLFFSTQTGMRCAPFILDFSSQPSKYKLTLEKKANVVVNINTRKFPYNQLDINNYHRDSEKVTFSLDNTTTLNSMNYFTGSNFMLSGEANDKSFSYLGSMYTLSNKTLQSIGFSLSSVGEFIEAPNTKNHILYTMLEQKIIISPFKSNSILTELLLCYSLAKLARLNELRTLNSILNKNPNFSFDTNIPAYFYQYNFIIKPLLNAIKGFSLDYNIIPNSLLTSMENTTTRRKLFANYDFTIKVDNE